MCVGGGGDDRFADFISFFLMSYENEIILTKTKLFHFRRIF